MFITSSYSRVRLRIWKWCFSTFFCAVWMERSSRPLSPMASPSPMPFSTNLNRRLPVAKSRSRSSSRERKKRVEPASPWRAQRPRNCRSMRRDSCRSVPMTCRPPIGSTPWPSLMSVPRPAMFVAMVTEPFWPARVMISASCSWYLALSTLWMMPFFLSNREMYSLTSTETVPTRTGRPCRCTSLTSSSTALYFSRRVL